VLLRLAAVNERLRSSLFFVPMAYVGLGLLLGVLGVAVDRTIVDDGTDLPFGLTSTVDSARAVLGTVASATISFAGIAFSVSLLVIQLGSSQFSPRIVHGLLRDPFSKRIMGIVIGTFTFCLVVLRSVRGPLEEGGDPVIPNLSVGLAVLLGVVSILSTIAFIDHAAHAMDVTRILATGRSDGVGTVHRLWDDGEGEDRPVALDVDDRTLRGDPPADHLVVTHAGDGWIQNMGLHDLCEAAPPGATIRLETEVGRYAIAGTPLCTIWPAPDDPDAAAERVRRAVVTGSSRTTEHDVGYGVRQLADVALRALSPGVNDPTTAQDALFHMGSVLRAVLEHEPPPLATQMEDDRVLLRPQRLDHAEMIDLAFDELRLAAAGQPTVCIYVLELAHLLDQVARDLGRDDARRAIRTQAALVRTNADDPDLGAHDADRIRDAHDRRFGPDT
jgi:uncharacterized membrane protein